MNSKSGNLLFSMPILLMIFILFIIIFFKIMISLILPFIYYQKLEIVATKYMFVIEKFGYLTNSEKNNLLNDLKLKGFNLNNININYPEYQKSYGELLEFNINYKYFIKGIKMLNINDREMNISVNKNSFSKI